MKDDKKVPQLRFPEFTDAWKQRKLGDILKLLKDGTHGSHKDVTNGHYLLSAKNIKDGRIFWDKTDRIISDEDYKKIHSTFKINKGDVLLTIVGSIGETAIFNVSEEITFQRSVAILRPIDEVSSDFLYSEITSPKFQKFLNLNKSTSAQPGIYLGDLANISFSFPENKEEQKMIGRLFTGLNSTITLQQRKLNSLQKLKKGLLQKMFPKNGENIPEIRFPEFSDAWKQRKLEQIIDVGSGRDYKHLSEGGIPVYGTGGYMLSVNEALSWEEDAIGIGRKGTIDKPYILQAPFWTVDTLFYAIPKKEQDLDFLYCIFQNIDWKKKDESTGVPSLSKTIINKTYCMTPNYDEQKKIGCFFSKIDNLITLQQRKLESLQKLKKGLLQQMFI